MLVNCYTYFTQKIKVNIFEKIDTLNRINPLNSKITYKISIQGRDLAIIENLHDLKFKFQRK